MSKVKLGDIAYLYKKTISPALLKEKTKYLGLEHFLVGGGISGFDYSDKVSSIQSEFHKGDILYGKLRPYFNKIFMPDFNGICSSEIWVIRPSDAGLANPTFLYYSLFDSRFSIFVNSHSNGTRMPRGNWEQSSKYIINLPPLDEQVRIASVLSSLDNLIDNSKKEVELYRDLFDNMLKLNILEESKTKTLGEVFSFKEGGTSKAENRKTDGKYEIMGANGIISGKNVSDKSNCQEPSVLVGKIGSAGALNLTYKPVWVTNNAFYVESKDGLSRETIFALLKTIDFKKFIGGSANPYMPKENFIDATITIPTNISKLDELCGEIQPLIDALVEENIKLSKMRDELLPLLISGEITVKEAEEQIEG